MFWDFQPFKKKIIISAIKAPQSLPVLSGFVLCGGGLVKITTHNYLSGQLRDYNDSIFISEF